MTRQAKPRTRLAVQPLEAREVPATLVSPTTLTYQDADGDAVKVVFSKKILTQANVNSVFAFSAGSVDGDNAAAQQLTSINLVDVAGAARTGVTVTATAANGGDGFANVGQVVATGLDLGAVKVDGDLGRFKAGSQTPGVNAVASVTAQSIGKLGTTTGAVSLLSDIGGNVGTIHVVDDVVEAQIWVDKLGKLTIGGSLRGGDGNATGDIEADSIGSVTIGGSLVGGNGPSSGRILADSIGDVRIGKDLLGGGGQSSGSVISNGPIGTVTIGGELLGGSGDFAGQVDSDGAIKAVKVGARVKGGSGGQSGTIHSDGPVGTVTIAGSLLGGSGFGSGSLVSESTLQGVTVGALVGANGHYSGRIQSAGACGPIKVSSFLIGDTGFHSGEIDVKSATSIAVGFRDAAFPAGLQAGTGNYSARIAVAERVGSVKIAGTVLGGDGFHSGTLDLGSAGTVTVGEKVTGAGGPESGSIRVGAASAITVGGNLGGTKSGSGSIFGGDLGRVSIGGSLVSGSAQFAQPLENAGSILADRITSLVIGGELVSGLDETTAKFENNGAVRVTHDIGSVTIGSVRGNPTNPVYITAGGRQNPKGGADVAIGRLTIRGSAQHMQVLAGYDRTNVDGRPRAVNADAQIGAVTVGGDWTASSVVAGAVAGDNGYFGDGDANEGKTTGAGVKDTAGVTSKIGSLTIRGAATSSADGADHYGVMAEAVGAVKVGPTAVALKAGTSNDLVLVGGTDDFKVKEV
jgi:hypothetical protein